MYRHCFTGVIGAVRRYIFPPAPPPTPPIKLEISEPFNFKREGSGLQALQQAQGLVSIKQETV